MAPKTAPADAPTFAEGSWQATLAESAKMLDRSAKARNRASNLLWAGALTGIEGWLENNSDDRDGENLYAGSGQAATPGSVVDRWVAEVAEYDIRTDKCRGVCGHYTQVVWRDSQRLGCAMVTCGDSEVWVCNYDPPGNFLGQKPY